MGYKHIRKHLIPAQVNAICKEFLAGVLPTKIALSRKMTLSTVCAILDGAGIKRKKKLRLHRLTNVDPVNRFAVCSHCGPVRVISRGQKYQKSAVGAWRCGKDVTIRSRHHDRGHYRKHLKHCCERCGFVPEHECQMDIHHRDGNKKNNVLENLATLCACCHRLHSLNPTKPQPESCFGEEQ